MFLTVHLHGTSYAVLAVEKLNTSISMDYIKKLDAKGMLKRNLDRPPIKDTVTVISKNSS
jgi:L-ascorbate oxidase